MAEKEYKIVNADGNWIDDVHARSDDEADEQAKKWDDWEPENAPHEAEVSTEL